MRFLKHILIIVLAVGGGMGSAFGQRFIWEADMDFRFDNREFKDTPLSESQTLFGARLIPQAGIGWGKGNSLMLGVDLLADFGQRTFYTDPALVFYYGYDWGKFRAAAGVFPRKKLIGTYSNAFFSDSVRFYDSELEGLLLQYVDRNGYLELGCDWNSMYSADRREKFMVFSAGSIRQGVAYAGYNFDMYHHAGSYTLGGVVDNILIYPYIGLDLSRRLFFDKLYLQVGWLQAFQNNRKYEGYYRKPNGAQIEARIEKRGIGIYNNLYLGDNLMPFYASNASDDHQPYGSGLYFGEPFYRTESGIYNRLEIYWEPFRKSDVKGRIASVHHFDGHHWVWQQVVSLSVTINH